MTAMPTAPQGTVTQPSHDQPADRVVCWDATTAVNPGGAESLSGLIEATAAEQFADEVKQVAGTAPAPDARALVAPESEEDKS